MTKRQINLVRASFEQIAPINEKVAALFYAKLFELNPKLRPLFKGDIFEQGKKLMQVISFAVQHLDKLDQIVPQVQALGARHKTYGVEDHDYETVGKALLWTLEKALGRQFTSSTREAWAAVYNLLAKKMKEGSRQTSEITAVGR